MNQLDLFTLPTCPCGMGPFVHDGEIDLFCACGVDQFAGASEYLDWLAAGPAERSEAGTREANLAV